MFGVEFVLFIECDGNIVMYVIVCLFGIDKVKWARKTSGRVFVVEFGWFVVCVRVNI